MKQTLKYSLLFVLFVCCTMVSAQDYRKDSLQIKVYTEIEYKAGIPIAIKLKKVFCDYCSKTQLDLLGKDAVRRTESEKNDPKNKLKDGKKKIAIYIRIAKKDFARIREDE
ncbi:hypothetical protein [Lacinutrix jangbogonensis]|uniref:hypothetical protein n=1 Tax=Lacinutrix jangbogonensis TaxID=1469557 RepID=UPI001F14FB9D|nr:hypothetical protein [Lacinutrix jangbogonensis]